MVTGLASYRRICGLPGPTVPTVTVTVELIVPFAPVADRVYVVVWVGVTDTEPVRGSTLPTPGVIVADVALSITQLRVDACPGWMLAGIAENWTIRTCAGTEVETVVVALAWSPSVLRTVRRNA